MSKKIMQLRKLTNIIYKGLAILTGLFVFTGVALAQGMAGAGGTMTLASVASNITSSLGSMAQLITAGSYVLGFGFAIGAILKFKAHKDNPTQIQIGTPIALIFIAAALIFLPTIFGVTGETMFGSGAEVGGISGVTNF